ncbi:hypothetical protein E0H73_20590 [Kribbella pittospori]|uniref:Uncharacterized protein n=1 Tax=Kribbella pittospori TaxID=722689 RepID=A0A4R0KQ60_9ACTN|nr:hypothetical protein [Kribbella pittospori]TCC60338.1 hypothetical protein E0H73_20590 [Kribbella pittospori]
MKRPRDERGAALVIVMIIITVVGLATGAVLSKADTSQRATIGLRDQAGSVYDADGAAQAAINQLRRSTFANDVGSQCFGGSDTLALPGFYPATNGQSGAAKSSASVVCKGEAGTGQQGAPVPISSDNKPGNAILTLGTASSDGQVYGQSNKKITIHGGVISNAGIDSSQAQLTATGGIPIRAVGSCTGPITPSCTKITTPVSDPNYSLSADPPVTPASVPACNNKNKVAEFRPGFYNNADLFNNCQASWMLFDPGTYYFDFTLGASHVWTVNGTMVGGTVPGLTPGSVPAGASAPSVPGTCVNPIESVSAVGVTFVFGGDTQLAFAKDSQAEICATYHANSIPTAVYGLKSDVVNGAITVRRQSGCVITTGGCDLISDGGNGTKPSFYFEGFAYAPKASINIAVNNTAQPYFNFGIVTRRLTLTTTGSATTEPLISLPDDSLGYGTASTIVDLTVYVCPGVTTSSCSSAASKRLQLTARVQITDPTGSPVAGARQMTVLSWSVRR